MCVPLGLKSRPNRTSERDAEYQQVAERLDLHRHCEERSDEKSFFCYE